MLSTPPTGRPNPSILNYDQQTKLHCTPNSESARCGSSICGTPRSSHIGSPARITTAARAAAASETRWPPARSPVLICKRPGPYLFPSKEPANVRCCPPHERAWFRVGGKQHSTDRSQPCVVWRAATLSMGTAHRTPLDPKAALIGVG